MSINYFECLKLLVSMYMYNTCAIHQLRKLLMVLSLRRVLSTVLSVYQQAPNGKNCSLISLVRYDVDCWRVMICAENQLAFFTPTVCRRVNKSIRFFFVQAFFVVSDTFPRVHCCEVGSKRLHTAKQTQSPASKVACSWRLQSKSPIGRSTAQ